MIYFIIILSAILVISLAIFFGLHFNRKKYISFVLNNSLRLQSIKKINSEVRFFPAVNLDQFHRYDNEKHYATISCEDYLIYQLQYQVKKIIDQIKKINWNKTEYYKYCDRINSLPSGNFLAPTGKLKLKTLEKIEKELCKKAQLTPTTRFSLAVELYCSKINGEIYASKQKTFSSDEILVLIKRLNNKYGDFYRDRGIWDAICRVERGKVSNKLRFEIYERDDYRCRNCGSKDNLEIDHIIPISKGGKSTYDNLQTLCHKCNVEKGNKL